MKRLILAMMFALVGTAACTTEDVRLDTDEQKLVCEPGEQEACENACGESCWPPRSGFGTCIQRCLARCAAVCGP